MSAFDTNPEDQQIELRALLGAVLSRWLRIVVVTLVALGVTYAILLFMPKMYESTAGLLVEQRTNPAITAVGQQTAASGPSIPVEAMMSSQIELIKSRDTLMQVIDTENLRSESEFTGVGFSPVGFVMQLIRRTSETRSVDETVLQNLNERLRVVRERDSAVISINVLSRDPTLAARIANAIAQAHVRRRAALSLSDTAETSQWLEQEITRLRVKVGEAEAAVADYRVEKDLFTGTDNTSILDQQLTAISTQITEAQQRKNAAESRANLIRELLAQGRPIDGVQDVQASVVIQQLSQTKATLQGELAERSATLLAQHPTVRALTAQIAEIEDQIEAEARRVAGALEAQAQIEANLAASLRDDLARQKLNVSEATRSTVTLESLEREAKAQRDLLESYLLRYSDATSRTDAGSALPDVRQITVAAPAVDPAWPKTTLVLGGVAFVAVALQVGGILFGELMSGRALADRSSYRREDEAGDETDYIEDEPDAVGDLFEGVGAEQPPDGFVDMERFRAPASEVDTVAAAARKPESRIDSTMGETTGENALELSNLSADIAIGRVRVVMLAALTSGRDCELVADMLIGDALKRGLSIVRIDAGSGRTSQEPGLTDLSTERASFGDVVHRVRDGLAEVPWGQEAALERRSTRPLTLIEALTDIYEVVIVMTGKIGMASTLPMFAGVPCRLVLVGPPHPARESVEAALEDAANLGYDVGQIVHPPQLQVA
jgi:polysaccharide biosynthesis transport protein